MTKTISFLIAFICFFPIVVKSQDLDFEAMSKSTDIRISGGISANTVFYNSNELSSRDPFTYYLQGNLNFSWLTFSMPVSYSFTNQGNNLDYKLPYNFNRISIHPKYKWITGHIGEVSMNYSPYTLNGHQFTGAGVDIDTSGPLKFSVMTGRLLKVVEDDEENPQTIPSFKRMGYGSKISWEKEKYKLNAIVFYAKDKINSLHIIPDHKHITPKENLVISLGGQYNITQQIEINAEYASSALTQDLRSPHYSYKEGIAGLLYSNSTTSTEYFNAYKIGMQVSVGKTQVGVAYERVDPGYQTLGAYFFNNDFENITLNAVRPFFNNRLNLNFNIGYQRDNLNKEKDQDMSRVVGMINASLQASDRLTLTGSYSNFSTHTNQRLNQFDEINNIYNPEQQYIQTFKYQQLSQNANFNINWILAANKKLSQNINFNYSLAASANKTNNIIRIGEATNFHNLNLNYNIGFLEKTLNIGTAMNYTYVDITRNESKAWGPSVNISKRLFDNKLNLLFGSSYNTSRSKETTMDAVNIRANASYTLLKKHTFNLNAFQLLRYSTGKDQLSELTVTVGYNYSFDLGSPKTGNR